MSEPPLASSVIENTAKAFTPLLWAAGLTGIAYAGICYALYNYQEKLIFKPISTLLRTPAEVGLAYEDIWISLADNDRLHGWWLPNPTTDRVMLFCHGNYGNISYNLERLRFHHSLGFSILAFDYRGYGQSTQSDAFPKEQSTYADVEAAWQYLTKEKQISPGNITVCGHSMGGAIAIDLATRHPDMANLIITSSFTTMEDAIEAKKIYRAFPVKQLLNHPFSSLNKVKSLTIPVLYVHGDQDFDVPAKFSQSLYDATPEPKQIWIAPGADHNNISTVQTEAYAAVIKAFCENKQLQSV